MAGKVSLTAIAFDAGTQIRAAINEQVVAEYAERMREGVTFPPIVLFHDGTAHYLADGFHRYLASQRVGFTDIDADVQAGTKQDALWFALGANKANGHRMTPQDKRHAILLALQTWPDKSARQIAEQVGCDHSYVIKLKPEVQVVTDSPRLGRVTGKDGKSYPASRRSREESPVTAPPAFRSRVAVEQRRELARTMAADGHSSHQIASALGVTFEGTREICRKANIDVPADRVIGKSQRHDSARIIDTMVMDAENLTADVNLIDLGELDPLRFKEWISSLAASRKALDAFIRQLVKEQEKHGEAA